MKIDDEEKEEDLVALQAMQDQSKKPQSLHHRHFRRHPIRLPTVVQRGNVTRFFRWRRKRLPRFHSNHSVRLLFRRRLTLADS